MIEYDYPHHQGDPPEQHGKAVCCECGHAVSTYTPPQELTGLRFCNLHLGPPTGYEYSATMRLVKEKAA